MKIRIKGNSLRLRLMQQEVAQFNETGSIKEIIQFGQGPASQLVYRMRTSNAHETLTAQFSQHCITVFVPTVEGNLWATTEEVGMRGTQELGNGQQLQILIEKDFKCLTDRPDEDESDAFENPHSAC